MSGGLRGLHGDITFGLEIGNKKGGPSGPPSLGWVCALVLLVRMPPGKGSDGSGKTRHGAIRAHDIRRADSGLDVIDLCVQEIGHNTKGVEGPRCKVTQSPDVFKRNE
jgi:hypothetical protein